MNQKIPPKEITNKILSVLYNFYIGQPNKKDKTTISSFEYSDSDEGGSRALYITWLFYILTENHKVNIGRKDFDKIVIHLWRNSYINIPAFNNKDFNEKAKKMTIQSIERIGSKHVDTMVEISSKGIKKMKETKLINSIIIVRQKNNSKKYKIIINENYKSPIEVSRAIPTWNSLFELAEGERLPFEQYRSFFDYINSNEANRIYKKVGLNKTRILSTKNNFIVPNIDIEIISEKAYQTRKNST